jgi:hypothetical protein
VQDQEIQQLKFEATKKSTYLATINEEVLELRPSKDALNLLEKQTLQLEHLRKVLKSKENEISMLKSLIKTWQTQYVPHTEHSSSPKRLPMIKTAKSIGLSKTPVTSSINTTSKSIRYYNNYKTDPYNDIDGYYTLDNIIENSENKEDDLEKIKEIERKAQEDLEREKIENKNMEYEEKIKRIEDYKIAEEARVKKEQEDRLALEIKAKDEEKKKSKTEEIKKGRSKSPVKPPSKNLSRKNK